MLQGTADLFTFTKEIFNGNLHFYAVLKASGSLFSTYPYTCN